MVKSVATLGVLLVALSCSDSYRDGSVVKGGVPVDVSVSQDTNVELTVACEGVENFDVSRHVRAHAEYRHAVGPLLRLVDLREA